MPLGTESGWILDGSEPIPPICPNQSARITSGPTRVCGFAVERIVISGPGYEHWRIDELTIDGVSVIPGPIKTADLPDLERLSSSGEGGGGKRLLLERETPCLKEIAITITYTGDHEPGRHFLAAAIGGMDIVGPAR